MESLETSKYVELSLQDWLDEPAQFESAMDSLLSTFCEPFYKGEKHFVSRKLKLDKLWIHNVLEFNDKESGGVFGQG